MHSRGEKRIVVGFDGSDASYAAVAWARREAVRCQSPLSLVEVVPIGTPLCDPDVNVQAAAHECWDTGYRQPGNGEPALLARAAYMVSQTSPAIDFSARLVAGAPGPAILALGRDAQLIVIGARMRTRFGSVLTPSCTSSVIRGSTVPVVVLPSMLPSEDADGDVVVVLDDIEQINAVLLAALIRATDEARSLRGLLPMRQSAVDRFGSRFAVEEWLFDTLAGWHGCYPHRMARGILLEDSEALESELRTNAAMLVVSARLARRLISRRVDRRILTELAASIPVTVVPPGRSN